MGERSIEERLQHLEDIEEVKQIIARYAMGGDSRNDPAIMGGCFTENVLCILHGFGTVQGRDEVTKYVQKVAEEQILWTIHFMTTPVINFNPDGETGTVFFYLWELGRIRDPETGITEPNWIAGWYENEIAKEDGKWLFSKVELVLQVFVPNSKNDWTPQMPDRLPPPVWT